MPVKNKNIDQLKLLIRTLPDKPGVYQFLDQEKKVIYVGKAKSLRKRVASYFNKDRAMGAKLTMLVRKISDIKHIVVDTEFDALLLENNFIKKYQPRYNIQLKDDKSYPWICIKNEAFPRIFPTRHVLDDGSDYYGPYASVRMMNTLLDLVRQLYQLRTCKLRLTRKNIETRKFRICLEYHIGNCKGPCEGLQSEEEYNHAIEEIKNIIKGNISNVVKELKRKMKLYAGTLAFEKAQVVKEKIELLERYQGKSTVVNQKIHNVDVFSLINDPDQAFVNYMKVVNGAIVQGHTIIMKKKLEEAPVDLLSLAVTNLRDRFNSDSGEVIIPFKIDLDIPGVKLTVPKIGDKKQLLELSARNALYFKLEREKREQLIDPERHSKRILETMRQDLRMKETPVHIECFDNSNIQGDYPVAAMVCFKNARPAKKEYRHYNIKTVEGPNDFASMEEIILRRYKRLLDEKKPIPQLIVVDGGKGQLNAALKSLEKLGLRGSVTVIGIAKRLEEIYYPEDPLPIYLDKKSETLKIIQRLRDEAHRFGITHHRKKREKGTIKSILTDIPGVGYNTAQKLLWKFKSVKKIEASSLQSLQDVIGKSRALLIYNYFNK